MPTHRTTVARCLALVVLVAIGVALLHQHPAWHQAEKLASCPAAAFHAGAVLKSDPHPSLAVTVFIEPAPAASVASAVLEPAHRPWSSRAPPFV